MNEQYDSVMDLARKAAGREDVDLTGEFQPDPEAVAAWQTPLSQEDNGEFRYGNKSPTELRRMIGEEADPVEKAQMEKIMAQFVARGLAINEDDPNQPRAGEPYRGEPKEVLRADSVGALGDAVEPVEHVVAAGGGRHIPALAKSGEGLGMVEGPGGVWEES